MMHHNTGPPRLPRDRRGGVRLDPLVLLTQRVPSVREALLTVRIRTLLLPLLLVGVLGLVSSWFIASLAGVRRHALPPKNSTDVESLQRAAQITLPVKNGSVAICVAGGLRMFELTVMHLAKNLFSQLAHPDVFISAPLDENSYKALLLPVAAQSCTTNCHRRFPAPVQSRFTLPTILGNRRVTATDPRWRVLGIKFLAQAPLDESVPSGARILDAFGSPNGVQGLLQYFQLVEACSELLGVQEKRQGFAYEWVVRTRPDTYWMGPIPALESYQSQAYNYPAGSRWGGMNDRLAVARRGVAELGFQRLSVLPLLARWQPEKRYNSEKSLRAHLRFLDVPTKAFDFPFCTLTLRPYAFPPTPWGLPVFSLQTSAPINGAKCRPCTPSLMGEEAAALLDTLRPQAGLPWDPPRPAQPGYELCNASGAWEPGWGLGFDQQAGRAAASVRGLLLRLTFRECIRKLRLFLSSVAAYSGPQARMLCSVRRWGLVWEAMAQKDFTVQSVVAALAASNPGRAPWIIRRFPSLDLWDGERLPVPPLQELATCNSCTVLVNVNGTNAGMGRKYALLMAMRAQRWEVLRCGGAYNTQTCLFLRRKRLKPVNRGASSY